VRAVRAVSAVSTGTVQIHPEHPFGTRKPGVGNRHQVAETTGKVLALTQQMPGLVVLPAHDPTAAARLLSG
jgi:hypothetical protein